MNPYRVVDPTDVLWKRVGAWAVDATLATVVAAVIGVVAWVWVGPLVALLGAAVAAMMSWFVLEALIQGFVGVTPGKAVAGLRVVDAGGHRCSTAATTKRTVGWLIDGFPYLLPLTAFTAAVSTKGNQRLGDRWAHTWVIDRRYLGAAPVAVALPKDPNSGFTAYALPTMGDYLPASVDILTLKQMRDAPATSNPAPPVAPPVAPPSPIAPAALPAGTGPAEIHRPGPNTDPQLIPTAAPVLEPAVTRRDLEPRWDPRRRAYIRWNALLEQWVEFDEDQQEWVLVR